jgi:hypothetical protein
MRNTSPFQAGIVCDQAGSVGPNFPLQTSPGPTTALAKEMSGEFKLDAKYLETLHATAKFKYVDSVKLTFKDVAVLEVTDESVAKGKEVRTPRCKTSIEDRLRSGARVTMIASVLRASVTYVATFKTEGSLGASAKLEVMQGLAAELGANVASATETTVSGDNLYWGVLDDQWLDASLTKTREPGERTTRIPGKRLTILPLDVAMPGKGLVVDATE